MTNIQPPMEHFERPDPVLTNKIVTHLKSQGIFDQFRRECMADVDTKPAYHNLRQRVEGSVAAFLRLNPWRPDMNKNQLRDNLRKHIQSGGFLDIGVDRIVDQVVNPKIYTVFLPKVEEVVQSCLGMENDKPKFEPPPAEVKSEQPKFQDKHNLATRAKLPAPLMGPILKPLKPPEAEGRSLPSGGKPMDNGGDTDTEEAADKKYVVDEDDLEEKEEDEDDEESPPFEPHSEGDRLILGMRSDSSENSNDSQVVTTIVDDSLEERIDNNETSIKEESDKKDEDSSSDEYVPKTPTINMEESDGTVLEFNSISEYKQYHTKFEEDSFGNVEEVVSSQCINDNHDPIKEERSSNEEDFVSGSQNRKLNIDSYDDASNSSSDKESTSDEIKPAVFESYKKKQLKLAEYDHENEMSNLSINDAENEDYYTERSLDVTDPKIKELDHEHHEKHKGSSTSSNESVKSYNTNHKEHRESSNPHSSKDKTVEKEHQEKNRSSTSSKDKKDIHKKSEKHESSRDRHKEGDRKRSESSTKHYEKDARSKHHDKEKERDKDKKRRKSSEKSKKDKEDADKNRKESRHEHKDNNHESRSRDHHDKEKKKHDSRNRHSEGKEDHDSAHKREKDRRDDSKHHSSSRHSHRSSSEKHKSDKDHKHKGSSDRHKSRDKKSDKDSKDESRKKYRQHCKYTSDKDENRRSSDRDSSGPSGRTHMPSSSKSTSSRTHRESKVETGERTTSNSENTVSDNIEALQNYSKFNSINEHGIASPDLQKVEHSWTDSDLMESDWNSSKEEQEQQISENSTVNKLQDDKIEYSDDLESSTEIVNSPQPQILISEDQINSETDDYMDSFNHSTGTTNFIITSDKKQDLGTPSAPLNDSSSEKENIEQVTKEQINCELDGNNTDASLDEDSTVIKFKKPKIAKNIHEVKKIMEARRHLKRMEKKRMKLLMKYNSEEYESDEKLPSEDKLADESQGDIFRGFEDNISTESIEKYDGLIERLENEASQLEKSINYDQINSNLITSWIDLNPDLDTYIENTLKGKVHRRYRVHLPPICDEYYNYDAEQNVYFLIDSLDFTEQKEVLVDSNLNNLNSIYTTDQQENKTSYCKVVSQRRNLSEGPVPCTNSEITHESCDYSKQTSPKRQKTCKNTQPDNEVVLVSSNVSAKRTTKDISKKMDKSTDVIASPNVTFSLTFNQTYDEVLKEKAQNSVVSSKREVEEMYKTPLTVVKITNNMTSEQVYMKKFQSNSKEVPRITRSETILNGKIIETPLDSKQIPLISRISKATNVSTLSTRVTSRCANGVVSPDSKEGFTRGVSQKMINDVIGIQDAASDQGNISDQGSQSSEESSDQRRRRTAGCRQQQRYDSSDLYKPRLQLSSRRIRAVGVGSSPEGTSPVPQTVVTRKRSATSALNTSTRKRRR